MISFRYYVLRYSEPTELNYRRNGQLGVVANGVEEAIAVGKRIKPNITVWDIVHQGLVDGIAPNAADLLLDEC